MKIPFRSAVLALTCLAPFCASGAILSVQVTDSAGKPLADTVVVAAQAGAAMPRIQKQGEIAQRGLKFMPLVSVIQTGSRIAFPNNDKVKHHIYSFSPAKRFDQKLYSGVTAAPQVFDKAGLVVLGCNIHDRMVAYVSVVDSPYFAKTDAQGVARIELPAGGKYTVTAWHYNMSGATAQQAVTLGSEAPAALAFQLIMKPPTIEADAPNY